MKTQMKCSIMLHFNRIQIVCKGKNDLQIKEYIEDIQIFGMNMPFITSSEAKNTYFVMSGEATNEYSFSRFTR